MSRPGLIVSVLIVGIVLALRLSSAEAHRFGTCPSPSDAGRQPRYGPVMRGDLDGDGSKERVWISGAGATPGTCGIFLVARTDGKIALSHLLPPYLVGVAAKASLGRLPRIEGLLRLGRAHSLEVVVLVSANGEYSGFQVYRVWRHRLRLMTIEGRRDPRLEANVGLTNRGSVDCFGRPGSGLVGEYWAELALYRLVFDARRTDWRVAGAAFVRTRSTMRVVGTSGLSALRRGLSDQPFARCAGVRKGI